MSHIDEGALHAYLDGALDEYPTAEADRIREHLDACAECAEKLEVERAIRADAHAMLGLAAPVVEAPSFEELRAYVQRTRTARPGMGRMYRLGWAASVVLALGTGWMLRESQLQSRAPFGSADALEEAVRSPAAEAARSPAEAESDAVVAAESFDLNNRPDADDAAVAGRASGQLRSTAGGVAGPTAPAVTSDDPADASPTLFAERANAKVGQEGSVDPSVPATVEAAELDQVRDVVADAAGARLLGVATADSAPAEQSAEFRTERTAMLDADSTLPGAANAAEVVAMRERVDAPTDSAVPVSEPPTRAAEPTTAQVTAGAGQEARRRMEAPAPVVSALTQQNLDVQPSRAEAEEAVEVLAAEPLLSVPGYEVLNVTNLGEGRTPYGARVEQRMPDGRDFEVIHLEPEIDPSVLPTLPEGWGEAAAESQAGWVFVRGDLTRAELDDLLTRLFPGTP